MLVRKIILYLFCNSVTPVKNTCKHIYVPTTVYNYNHTKYRLFVFSSTCLSNNSRFLSSTDQEQSLNHIHQLEPESYQCRCFFLHSCKITHLFCNTCQEQMQTNPPNRTIIIPIAGLCFFPPSCLLF